MFLFVSLPKFFCSNCFIFTNRFVAHLANLYVSSHRQSISLQAKSTITIVESELSKFAAVAKQGPAVLVTPVLIAVIPV